MDGEEGREVNSRKNIQGLMGRSKLGGFYTLADGSHKRVSNKGETYLICSLGDHSICLEIGLLAERKQGDQEGAESGVLVRGGHAWTSVGSVVVRIGEI